MSDRVANLFARIPTTLTTDERVLRAGLPAFGLHVAAWLYAAHHLSDGFVARGALRALAPAVSPKTLRALADRLESCGLWTPEASGWRISGFAEVNLSRAEIQHRAVINAQNGAKGGRPPAKHADSLSKINERETDSVSSHETDAKTLTEQNSNETPPNNTSGRKAAEVWESIHATKHGSLSRKLNQKQIGQLRDLADKYGLETYKAAVQRFLDSDDRDVATERHPVGWFVHRASTLVDAVQAAAEPGRRVDAERVRTVELLKHREALLRGDLEAVLAGTQTGEPAGL